MIDPVQPAQPEFFHHPYLDQPDLAGPQGLPITLPPQAPAPPGAAVRLRAVAVALLNLSGLGLGYVVMRRWVAAALCWIVTGILLLIVLPAGVQPVPVGWVVAYLVALTVAAVHGAARAVLAPPMWPRRSWLALMIALVLLAVPAGGVVLYDQARSNAIQQMLLGRLREADDLVAGMRGEPFTDAEPGFDTALATYRDLLDHHRGSRAGRQVPGRLAAFYQAVAAPYGYGDYCDAIAPLTYLRTLPATTGNGDLGVLAAWPDDRLATSLYQCGMGNLDNPAGSATLTDDLNLLMKTFPAAPQTAKVAPAIATEINGVNGSDPCTAITKLHTLDTQISTLNSHDTSVQAALAKDLSTTRQDVESGTFACGEAQYKKGDFTSAESTMNGFVTTYPNDPENALAGKFVIAAQIAENDPDAGRQLPTLASGGSVIVTITNDSPNPLRVLYTGAATGTVDIAACTGCSVYNSERDARQNACSDGSINYPRATISIPPGTTYFLHKDTHSLGMTPKVLTEQTSAGDIYTDCAYETSLLASLIPPVTITPPEVAG